MVARKRPRAPGDGFIPEWKAVVGGMAKLLRGRVAVFSVGTLPAVQK
jgi:hypothetical protein